METPARKKMEKGRVRFPDRLRFASVAAGIAALLLALPGFATGGAVGPAHLVADLDPGLSPFDPNAIPRFSSYTAVNGRVVFFSFLAEGDPDRGHTQCALWETGGSGAERLADLCGGTDRLDPSFVQLRVLATTGAVAFFTDSTGALWRTDATAAGTYPLGGGALKAALNGDRPPRDAALGPDGRTLFYDACTPADGCQLWTSDGTRAGTREIPLVAFPASAPLSDPTGFQAGGGTMLFATRDRLWASDGTPAGTIALVQVPGAIQNDLLAVGDNLFFVFNSSGADTVAVFGLRGHLTTYVSPLFPVPGLNLTTGVRLHTAGGRVFFTVFSPAELSLWEIHGTRLDTHRLGPAGLFTSGADAFFALGRRIVFAAGQGVGSGLQLWVLDPGVRRPRLLRPYPFAIHGLMEGAVFAGRLFFAGQDQRAFEPWQTDGTTVGTRALKRLAPGLLDGIPAQFRVFAGRLVLTTQQGDVWASDGTPSGTVRLAGGAAGESFLPLDAAPLGPRIVFSGLDPAGGLQPFVSDLTPAGTRPIAEIGGSLAASSRPEGLTALGDKVLFAACKGATGAIRASDGTPAGTYPLPDTRVPCPRYPPPVSFERAGGFAFFFWKEELWRTDGTRAGTRVLAAGSFYDGVSLGDRFLYLLNPVPTPPNDFEAVLGLAGGTGLLGSSTVHFGFAPGKLASAGNEAFFIASPARFPFPQGLWRTDGTAAGTYPLLVPATVLGVPLEVVHLGERTYLIAAREGGIGETVWSTDGTAAGTAPLAPAADFRSPFDLVVFHGRIYFWALSGPLPAPVYSLYGSDGTAAGTAIVKSVPLAPLVTGQPLGPLPPRLTVAGDLLFFRADDGVHGTEIWKSDGTPDGTAMVKDVNPGPDASLPDSLVAAGDGLLYFAATDGEHGVELWRSDGTEAGTTMVQDVFPGPAPSNPEQLTAADGNLFFTADDGTHGRELWALPLPR